VLLAVLMLEQILLTDMYWFNQYLTQTPKNRLIKELRKEAESGNDVFICAPNRPRGAVVCRKKKLGSNSVIENVILILLGERQSVIF